MESELLSKSFAQSARRHSVHLSTNTLQTRSRAQSPMRSRILQDGSEYLGGGSKHSSRSRDVFAIGRVSQTMSFIRGYAAVQASPVSLVAATYASPRGLAAAANPFEDASGEEGEREMLAQERSGEGVESFTQNWRVSASDAHAQASPLGFAVPEGFYERDMARVRELEDELRVTQQAVGAGQHALVLARGELQACRSEGEALKRREAAQEEVCVCVCVRACLQGRAKARKGALLLHTWMGVLLHTSCIEFLARACASLCFHPDNSEQELLALRANLTRLRKEGNATTGSLSEQLQKLNQELSVSALDTVCSRQGHRKGYTLQQQELGTLSADLTTKNKKIEQVSAEGEEGALPAAFDERSSEVCKAGD